MMHDSLSVLDDFIVKSDFTVLEEEQWRARGRDISQAYKRQQWEVADWINDGLLLLNPEPPKIDPALLLTHDACYRLGRAQQGEAQRVYDLAEELFPNYSRSSLRTLAYVARSFPAYMRIYANLSFSHYMAALPMVAEKRLEWLAKADAAKWSVATLRAAIYLAMQPVGISENAPASEPSPAAKPKPPITPKTTKPPVWDLPLNEEKKSSLNTLAKLRCVQPMQLAATIVAEYVAEFAEEIEQERDREQKERIAQQKSMRDSLKRAQSKAARVEPTTPEPAKEEEVAA